MGTWYQVSYRGMYVLTTAAVLAKDSTVRRHI